MTAQRFMPRRQFSGNLGINLPIQMQDGRNSSSLGMLAPNSFVVNPTQVNRRTGLDKKIFMRGGRIHRYSTGGAIGAGAATGAMTGASLGSILPGAGTIIGAGAGALIGGISGFFKNKKEKEALEAAEADKQQQLRFNNATIKGNNDRTALGLFPTRGVEDVNFYNAAGGFVPDGQEEFVAEGDEVIMHPQETPATNANGGLNGLSSDMSVITGDSHDAQSGGVGMAGGDFIFSKRTKTTKALRSDIDDMVRISPKDTSYAGYAEALGNKIGKMEEKLETNDPFAISTAQQMIGRYNEALELLAFEQEQRKK